MSDGISTAIIAPRNDVLAIEKQAATTEPGKGRLLSEAEWADIMPPFHWCRVEFNQWGNLEYDIARKFVQGNATGWVYFSDKRFIFEKEDDMALFVMWAENKPMHEKK